PYGYNKADTIATRILSLFIFFAGAQLAYSSIKILVKGSAIETPAPIAIYVTVISIIFKLVLAVFLSRTGKKAESQMLVTGAKNMQNDIFISLSVLVSLLFVVILEQPVIDRIIALIISGFIIYSFTTSFLTRSTGSMWNPLETLKQVKNMVLQKKKLKTVIPDE
ncbi:MAG: cation transporter, partial [Bacteroidales bacterium]